MLPRCLGAPPAPAAATTAAAAHPLPQVYCSLLIFTFAPIMKKHEDGSVLAIWLVASVYPLLHYATSLPIFVQSVVEVRVRVRVEFSWRKPSVYGALI